MRLINAEVEFLRKVPDGMVRRGFEQQRYVFHDDGTMSLSVFSVASELRLAREVVLNVDALHRPVDSYVKIHPFDGIEGRGWFRFDDNGAEADIWNVRKGLTHEAAKTSRHVTAFGAHPISCDALMMAAFDRSLPERVQHVGDMFMSSAHHFGAVGPEISPVQIEIEYVGAETTETRCGSFETDHWRILPGNAKTGHTHPGEDIWTLKDGYVFIRAEIAAIGYVYELTAFQEMTV